MAKFVLRMKVKQPITAVFSNIGHLRHRLKNSSSSCLFCLSLELRKDCVDTAECPELQKKYTGTLSFYLCKNIFCKQDLDSFVNRILGGCVTEMQAEYNDTISKLNNDILKKGE